MAGRTLLDHALADLAAAGVEEALVVTSPAKPELAATLGTRRHGIALEYALQPDPRGLADALSLAEEFAGGEPFLCWLPDNLWSGAIAASAQLASAAALRPADHLVALLEIAGAELPRYGAAGFVDSLPEPGDGRLVRIMRVHDKGSRPPPGDPAVAVLKGFPLDLWQPDLFGRIRAERGRHRGGELDDTPILQELAREGRLFGVALRGGRLFDCGIPAGLAAARAALGGE